LAFSVAAKDISQEERRLDVDSFRDAPRQAMPQLFCQAADFDASERVMVGAHQRDPIRILAYCILSNDWRFVVWPEPDGQLGAGTDVAAQCG
jgi:hypothetical protein